MSFLTLGNAAIVATFCGALIAVAQLIIYFWDRPRRRRPFFDGWPKIDDRPYTLSHAEEKDIIWIYNKSCELHGRNEASPYRARLSWFHKCPRGVWVVKDRSGRIRGSVEIFPVVERFVEDLKLGLLHEKEKTTDDICGEITSCSYLYVESVIAVDDNNVGNPWILAEILRNSRAMLDLSFPGWREKPICNQSVYWYQTRKGRRKSNAAQVLDALGFKEIGFNDKQGLPIFIIDGQAYDKVIAEKFG